MASGSYLAGVARRAGGLAPASPLLRPPATGWPDAPGEPVPALDAGEHPAKSPVQAWAADPTPLGTPLPPEPEARARVGDVRRAADAPVPAPEAEFAVPRSDVEPPRAPPFADRTLSSTVTLPRAAAEEPPSRTAPVGGTSAALEPAGRSSPAEPINGRRAESPPAATVLPAAGEVVEVPEPPPAGAIDGVGSAAPRAANWRARGRERDQPPHAEPPSRATAEPRESAAPTVRIGTVEVIVSAPPPAPFHTPPHAVIAGPRSAARLARGYSSSLGLGQT
jgi:hypothetical protein